MGGFKLNITDPSLLDDLLHPHVQSLMQPKFGAPSPNQPTTQVPMRPSGPELEAPPNVPQTPQGAMPASGSPSSIPKPTRQESNAAGKAEFKAGMPTLTEEPGTSGYFQKQLEQQDYKKEHPWGSPISEQPGFLGKLGHIAGRIGNIAGDVLAPGVTSLIPGSDLNNAMQRRSEIGNFDRAKQQETAQEGVEQRPGIAEATGELKGQLEAQKEQAAAERNQATLASNEKRTEEMVNKPPKPTFQEQSFEEWHQAHPNGTRVQFEKETKEAERTPRQPTDREEWQKDHPNEPIENYWAAKKEAGAKPTADEQRRSDLAENLNENLNALEDIVKRRPELFGPLSGRWAELKQKFGSDDPDLGALQTIEHQIGMAQISAHGMRSAQGVAAAADSIMNNLHNGPQALLSSTAAVRNSVKTFTQDVERAKGGASSEAVPERPKGVPAEAKWDPKTRTWNL